MRIADEMRFVRGWLMIAMTALLLACGGGGGGGDGAVNPNVAYTYRPPAEIADGWRVAHARDLGIDVALLETLLACGMSSMPTASVASIR